MRTHKEKHDWDPKINEWDESWNINSLCSLVSFVFGMSATFQLTASGVLGKGIIIIWMWNPNSSDSAEFIKQANLRVSNI